MPSVSERIFTWGFEHWSALWPYPGQPHERLRKFVADAIWWGAVVFAGPPTWRHVYRHRHHHKGAH